MNNTTKRRRSPAPAKRKAKRRINLKGIFVTLSCMVLVAVVSIGGTMAWLVDKSDTVSNTFVAGNVTITLDDAKFNSKGDFINVEKDPDTNEDTDTIVNSITEATRVTSNDYKLVPGNTYHKDPTVTVKAGSEACYLFVEVDAAGTEYFTYGVDSGWTQGGTGNSVPTNVYYRTVDASTEDQKFTVLTNNIITISSTEVTSENMATVEEAAHLDFVAYAVQKDNVSTVDDAWRIAKP